MGLILCGLLLGLARTVFFPKEINYYENRYANRAALPTPGSYADGTFQDQLEAALGDQTPFAERFKARYNDLSSKPCWKTAATIGSAMCSCSRIT